jgi:hypothetical protein
MLNPQNHLCARFTCTSRHSWLSERTKRSNTGKIMRLRCRGVQSTGGKGDHLLELQVMLPGST